MAKTVLVVVNPISGDIDKKPIVEAIKKEIKSRNVSQMIYYTTGEKDEEAIEKLLRYGSFDRVLVVGGDGTIAMVAQHLLNTDGILGFVSAGSANGLAVNFGFPENLKHQINLALSDSVLKIDTLELNGRFGLHISDLGINAELIKNYNEGSFRGKFGYFIQSFPTLLNSDFPFDFKISTEGEEFERTGALLAIANANKFGTGATINPNGKINDGKFEILVFKKLSLIEMIKRIGDNPELSSEFVDVISTTKATITTKNPIPFQIDGEYLGEKNKVEVSINSHSLNLALPKTFIDSCN